MLASDCFFFPKRFPKNPPSPPPLLLGVEGRVVIRTVMSKLLTSLMPTLRTRKAVLRFAARNAAPVRFDNALSEFRNTTVRLSP